MRKLIILTGFTVYSLWENRRYLKSTWQLNRQNFFLLLEDSQFLNPERNNKSYRGTGWQKKRHRISGYENMMQWINLRRRECYTRRCARYLFSYWRTATPYLLFLKILLQCFGNSYFRFLVNLGRSNSTSTGFTNGSTWIPKIFLIGFVVDLKIIRWSETKKLTELLNLSEINLHQRSSVCSAVYEIQLQHIFPSFSELFCLPFFYVTDQLVLAEV